MAGFQVSTEGGEVGATPGVSVTGKDPPRYSSLIPGLDSLFDFECRPVIAFHDKHLRAGHGP